MSRYGLPSFPLACRTRVLFPSLLPERLPESLCSCLRSYTGRSTVATGVQKQLKNCVDTVEGTVYSERGSTVRLSKDTEHQTLSTDGKSALRTSTCRDRYPQSKGTGWAFDVRVDNSGWRVCTVRQMGTFAAKATVRPFGMREWKCQATWGCIHDK